MFPIICLNLLGLYVDVHWHQRLSRVELYVWVLWETRSGQGRDPYETIGSGPILAIFRDATCQEDR